MTTECYFSSCKHHSNQTDPEDGPFCYEKDCKATPEEEAKFRKEREAYLKTIYPELNKTT